MKKPTPKAALPAVRKSRNGKPLPPVDQTHPVGTSKGAKRPPAAGMGRKKGSPNKVTRIVKDAIIRAAELEGEDGKGKDGVVGYMRVLARQEKKAFAQLLGRVVPLQIIGDTDAPFRVIISPDDARIG